MKTILIFAGTTEGRVLTEALERNKVPCHVCVATEYGAQLIQPSEYITVHAGRLNIEEMMVLYDSISCDLVIDATHPYADIVTATIIESTAAKDIPYLRLLREKEKKDGACTYYSSVEDCVAALEKTEGNILLTTGSKDLAAFTKESSMKERLYARVLPGLESIQLCMSAGLEGKQIIAMQGPFSQAMNEAVLCDYHIQHLVTKESGAVGGVDTKIAAAKAVDAQCHCIARPEENKTSKSYSLEGILLQLENILEKTFVRGKVDIKILGIGPGAKESMTIEASQAIADADIVFGAQRMLDAACCRGEKKAFYLSKDILPEINKVKETAFDDKKIVILYSGDTGFYSGSRKMVQALKENGFENCTVLPGLSSISVLASKIQMDWQDAAIQSLHGVSKDAWMPLLRINAATFEKTFFIASGLEDIHLLGDILEDDVLVHLGYQLSYPEEKITAILPSQCKDLKDEGLYAGCIVNRNPEKKCLLPSLTDDFFLRGKVPMTKEEIRKLSICELNLREGETVYDIGCGTGSIAVQIGLLSPKLSVYALECNEEAVDLSLQNVAKAKLHNVHVIRATAPEGLEALPKADAAFIGGSKGNMREILETLKDINPSMRVVVNAVSMESICEMNFLIKEMNITKSSIKQVSVTNVKELGAYHMMSANNPVFIFSLQF